MMKSLRSGGHSLADELLEFLWADFAQALEARDLAAFAELGAGGIAFGFAVVSGGKRGWLRRALCLVVK